MYLAAKPPERPREVPRAQRRPLAKPLGDFARRYPNGREAMASAFQASVYSMSEIADAFGVSYSTPSRTMYRLEVRNGLRAADLADRDGLGFMT